MTPAGRKRILLAELDDRLAISLLARLYEHNRTHDVLLSRTADVTVVSRRGQTTVDMANGPVQRIQPFPEAIAVLEGLGAKNNHRCVSC